MKLFTRRIMIISILIILLSLLDFLDNTIIRLFKFEDEGTFELLVNFISPILEVSLMIWALFTGKKVINQMQNEEEHYKRLVQLAPEAIIIHKKGKILFINESGAKLLGSNSISELLNRDISEFIHDDSKEFFNSLLGLTGKRSNNEFNQHIKITRVDGAIIDLEYKSTKIDFKGHSARELIARDITVQKSEIEHVKRLAFRDELTGLPNRRAIMEHLTQLLRTSEKNELNFGAMFIDLDGFKQVNDSLGHDGGDILLKQVSEYFKKCVAEKGIVARVGGDEFLVILNQISHDEHIKVAEKMIESLSSPIIIFGKKARVTPSIGIALYPQHGSEATELIKNADMAMYQVKQRGKNKFHIYGT